MLYYARVAVAVDVESVLGQPGSATFSFWIEIFFKLVTEVERSREDRKTRRDAPLLC